MFFLGVRRVGNLIARLKIHRELSDLVAPLPIFAVAKARMIGIELHDRISIGRDFICIDGDQAHVNVVGKERLFCLDSHDLKTSDLETCQRSTETEETSINK